MCLFRKQRQRIEELSKKVDKLTNIVETNEFRRLQDESRRFKSQTDLIGKVRLKVKSAKAMQDENGLPIVKVIYEAPKITLRFDQDGNVIKDEFFYSINMLDIVSLDDMKRIQSAINEAKGK